MDSIATVRLIRRYSNNSEGYYCNNICYYLLAIGVAQQDALKPTLKKYQIKFNKSITKCKKSNNKILLIWNNSNTFKIWIAMETGISDLYMLGLPVVEFMEVFKNQKNAGI